MVSSKWEEIPLLSIRYSPFTIYRLSVVATPVALWLSTYGAKQSFFKLCVMSAALGGATKKL
jgi:hypothetical protein